MSNIPRPLDFSAGGVNRDYLSIFRDLAALVPAVCPEWTYQGEDDLGTALLQLVSYTADHLHYRADAAQRDGLVSTTQDRETIRELATWLGYFAKRQDAALVDVTFSLSAPLTESIEIPAGTRLQGSSGGTVVSYETTAPVTLAAGETQVSVPCINARTSGIVSVGTAVGTQHERFTLPDADVLYAGRFDDIEVWVDSEKATWTPMGASARPTTLAFWVRQIPNGFLEIRFGDGSFGRRLAAGQAVTARYRTGGGTAGRVAAGVLTTLLDTFTDSQGNTVTFTVTNPFRSFGGNNEEPIELIRTRAPAYFATQGRAVTTDDYAYYALSMPGVARARAVVAGVNGVLVYVVPDGAAEGTVMSVEALRLIERTIRAVRMATDVVAVFAATLIPIDVQINVFAYSNFRNAAVRQTVLDRFVKLPEGEVRQARDPRALRGVAGGILHEASNDLGQHLRLSDMIHAVERANGVDYLDVITYTRRPTWTWKILSGDQALDATPAISDTTVEETWTIFFTTATEFIASGSISGPQVNTGALGTSYTTDNGQVTFLLTGAGGAAGDFATLQVSARSGNIRLLPGEFPIPGELDIVVRGGI